jgi:TetR/AcrR family transcriptional regulator
MISVFRTRPGFDANKEARERALNHARRRIVLDAAWRVFASEGFDRATLRAIAREAGCTTGAIYPLFASKEAMYAELLSESLDRLYECIETSVGKVSTQASKLKAGALAFVSYYREKPDEVALGLYLWHGLRPKGLRPQLDRELNAKLDRALDPMRNALGLLGRLSDRAVRVEISTLFAFLIGALVVHQTGRLRMLGSDLDAIASNHLDALVSRIPLRRGRD